MLLHLNFKSYYSVIIIYECNHIDFHVYIFLDCILQCDVNND
jgi:hypothetical protein